jgi:DNA-binding CsgD family transcriptional regulator
MSKDERQVAGPYLDLIESDSGRQAKELVEALANGGCLEHAVKLSIINLLTPASLIRALLQNGHPALSATLADARLGLRSAAVPEPELESLLAIIEVLSRGKSERTCGQVRRGTDAFLIERFIRRDPGLGQYVESVLSADPRDDANAIYECILSSLYWAESRLAEGLELGCSAVSHGAETVWLPYIQASLAAKYVDIGNFEEAAALLVMARSEDARQGQAIPTAMPTIVQARLLMGTGRLAEARDVARTAVAEATRLGFRVFVPLALSVLGAVAIRTGDVGGAADCIRQYRTEMANIGVQYPSAYYNWVELQVIDITKGPRAAAELIEQHYASPHALRSLFTTEPAAAAWFVRTALAAGDKRLAKFAVTLSAELATENPDFTSCAAAFSHARGLLRRDADSLLQAAYGYRDHWARATVTRDINEILNETYFLASNDRTPDSLTKTERDIAMLVSQGLTNQQVAIRISRSPHTVNYHLRNIFAKLDVSSRVELAGYMHHFSLAAGVPDR